MVQKLGIVLVILLSFCGCSPLVNELQLTSSTAFSSSAQIATATLNPSSPKSNASTIMPTASSTPNEDEIIDSLSPAERANSQSATLSTTSGITMKDHTIQYSGEELTLFVVIDEIEKMFTDSGSPLTYDSMDGMASLPYLSIYFDSNRKVTRFRLGSDKVSTARGFVTEFTREKMMELYGTDFELTEWEGRGGTYSQYTYSDGFVNVSFGFRSELVECQNIDVYDRKLSPIYDES